MLGILDVRDTREGGIEKWKYRTRRLPAGWQGC